MQRCNAEGAEAAESALCVNIFAQTNSTPLLNPSRSIPEIDDDQHQQKYIEVFTTCNGFVVIFPVTGSLYIENVTITVNLAEAIANKKKQQIG